PRRRPRGPPVDDRRGPARPAGSRRARIPRSLHMTDHDLVVRGATLIDGTGADARPADVAVRNGVVTQVAEPGTIDGRSARTIDADGLLVTPGFVDIHAHYDGQATWDERMVPSSWHGVTTVVAGNCGVG